MIIKKVKFNKTAVYHTLSYSGSRSKMIIRAGDVIDCENIVYGHANHIHIITKNYIIPYVFNDATVVSIE